MWSKLIALFAASRVELVLFCGLGLVVVGAWPRLGSAALIAPGLVLVWLALPPRPPFFGD